MKKINKVLEFMGENKISSVLDIGANVGLFSSIVRMVFPNMDILMVEANPFCDNMLRNTGIPYEIVCLSNEKKQVKFYVEDKNMIGTGASYYLEKSHHYSMKNYTTMDTETLDEFIKSKYPNGKTFDLIKLDTQGSEVDIMRGGLETLSKSKYVLIEISVIEYNEGSPLKDEVFDFMKGIGFSPTEMVEEHVVNGKLTQEDWIFTRNER